MNDKNLKEIVNRIKDRRAELGYSFQDLADKTGLSKSESDVKCPHTPTTKDFVPLH